MREETKTINGFEITLPVGYKYDPKANRDDYSSYITEERGWREIMHHMEALTTVLAPHVKRIQPHRVLHAFGGLGATAQVIQQVVPGAEHVFWERSQECCEYLRSAGWADVSHINDSMKFMEQIDLKQFDVIIFDPSLGTIMSPGIVQAWDYMGKFKVPLTWVSDFATSKLHLNGKHYARMFDGLETPTPELYATGYDKFLRKRGRSIIEAIRDSFEMYFVIIPASRKTFPQPIKRMI